MGTRSAFLEWDQLNFKAHLTSGVPDGELHFLIAILHHLHLEIHTNCGSNVFIKRPIREAEENAALTNTGVPTEEQLECVVTHRGDEQAGQGCTFFWDAEATG